MSADLITDTAAGPNGTPLPSPNPLDKPTVEECHAEMTRYFDTPGSVLDPGAPLSLLPRWLWRDQFRWREGIHFDVCDIAGLGSVFDAQLLGTGYRCRVARLRVPVEVASPTPTGPRFCVDNLIIQLVDDAEPRLTIFGLFGGVFESRRLAVERQPSDDLTARLEW